MKHFELEADCCDPPSHVRAEDAPHDKIRMLKYAPKSGN
jgi:hypothetical protein